MEIYNDNYCKIIMNEKGAVKGDIRIRFNKKTDKVEDLSKEEFIYGVSLAKVCASILYESLQPQGTNIIINEEPLEIVVIARRYDDNINLKWEPTQIEPQEFFNIHEKIRDAAFIIGKEGIKDEKIKEKKEEEDQKKLIKLEEEKENYLIKQLIRLP